MVAELHRAFDRFEADPAARVLVVRGSGYQAFCSGADLKEMQELQAEGAPFKPVLPSLFEALLGVGKPTLAALNGDAIGGGFELALCCSLRIARAGIRVGLPEATLSMIPRYGTALLAALAPDKVYEYTLLGELTPIEKAAADGLVNRVVPADRFDSEVEETVHHLASVPGVVTRGIRAIVARAWGSTIDESARAPEALLAYASEGRHDAVASYGPKTAPTPPRSTRRESPA
jgi:enoyl-CoA hydratase/carnithine racemase